jgi:hypothetical protein
MTEIYRCGLCRGERAFSYVDGRSALFKKISGAPQHLCMNAHELFDKMNMNVLKEG